MATHKRSTHRIGGKIIVAAHKNSTYKIGGGKTVATHKNLHINLARKEP